MKKIFTKVGLLLLGVLCSYSALAQSTVRGTVTDEISGEPIPGVNVYNSATKTGVSTYLDGKYTIQISQNTTLVFSFVGYQSKEFEVTPSTGTLNVTLKEDIANLEEVVVTGLASGVKRANLANAITTISADNLTERTNNQTLDNALYGKVPGVSINASSGAPGGGLNVQFRGLATLGAGSSQPLYIIDGVYVDNSTVRTGRTQVSGASGGQNAATQDDASNRVADLNPDDIENIEILKGPSAAAIYGTRANAGVIIITTKRGKAGETKVRFSQDIGVAQGQNFLGFDDWNPDKIRAFFGTGEAGDRELALYNEALAAGRIRDWEQVLYGENALLSNTQVSLSGGTDKTRFFISGGALAEEGIIQRTGFERYSARVNVDHDITSRIKLTAGTNYVKSNTARGFTGNQNNTGGSLGYAIAYTPSYANLLPDENGNYPNNPYFNDNPLAIRDLGENSVEVDRFIASAGLDIDIWSNSNTFLKFTMNGGVDFYNSNSVVYFPEVLQHQQASANPGDIMWGRQSQLNSNLQAFFLLNTNVGELNLNTQVGAVMLSNRGEFLLSRGNGLAGGQQNLQWATVTSVQNQTNTQIMDQGIVAQEEINYKDQIMGTLGVRFDRSTLNANASQFYAFPKASLAANISNFDFWSVSEVNQLKLRVAYGETGGLPQFGNTFESLTPQLVGGNLGGQVGTRSIDPDLRPETAAELEFGVDVSAFDSRLVLDATFYDKTVKDLILPTVPAEASGVLTISQNAATLRNQGIEIGLGIVPVRTSAFEWFSKLMYWQNDMEITEMNVPAFTTGGFGPSLGSFAVAEGYSPTTIVGNPAIADGPAGFTVLGDRLPNFQMSWLNEFSIGPNLTASMLFHYKNGGQNINLSALLWDDGGTTPNWDGDANGNEVPDGRDRLLDWATNDNTSVYIQPSDYLKLREVGIYYTFPKAVLGEVFQKVKVGVSGNNFLLWTPYEGYDPEVSNFGASPIASSVDVTPYPSSRRLFFHLNLEF